MNSSLRALLLLTVVMFSLASCTKEEEQPSVAEQRAIDEGVIQQYLEERGLTSMTTASGLHYIIEEDGNGVFPELSSTVTVNYVGKLPNGGIFDENTSGPAVFPLQNVIQGWQEGIPYFSEGGSGTLLIPSYIAYGTTGSGSIPPNTVLIFEIELLMVE